MLFVIVGRALWRVGVRGSASSVTPSGGVGCGDATVGCVRRGEGNETGSEAQRERERQACNRRCVLGVGAVHVGLCVCEAAAAAAHMFSMFDSNSFFCLIWEDSHVESLKPKPKQRATRARTRTHPSIHPCMRLHVRDCVWGCRGRGGAVATAGWGTSIFDFSHPRLVHLSQLRGSR